MDVVDNGFLYSALYISSLSYLFLLFLRSSFCQYAFKNVIFSGSVMVLVGNAVEPLF